MDIKKFGKPPSIMRPAPFWAINEKITPEETARQMEDMIDAGLGGGFFHSRAGLITGYLGSEWFSSMKAALKVAKEKDGYLWLYDEDLWPSGNAGGQVASMKDEYRAAQLKAFLLGPGEKLHSLNEDSAVRYLYALERRDGLILEKIKDIPVEEAESVVDCERLVMVREYAPKTSWWSGESYANLLHPDAMREFIKLTHEVYYEKLGDEFGNRIPGIFTDEPNLAHWSGIPWHEGIPDKYREWNERDFRKDLPYIFFDGKEARHIRLLVHRTILKQFLESYSKPVYDWCEAHNIKYTGHYNAEDTFASQIISHCGGVMAHYRYMHIPGIDHLCRQIDGFLPMLLTCKQVSSAARQMGRKRVLTEIFGVSRHTNTFEDFKWLGDFDLVLGANLFCPHLSWYSAKGKRKRDFPPVWNYQQTYWKELPVLNDYFTRISYALTCGKPDVKILLLHSIESAIAGIKMGIVSGCSPADISVNDMKEADEMDSAMRKTLDAVLNTGYDCDLGDENFIEECGIIKGKNFAIGKMSYKIVVIPQSRTWREKTVLLLERFIEKGGVLIVLGKTPEEIDGLSEKERWEKIISHKNVYSLPSSREAIQNAISFFTSLFSYTLTGTDGRFFRNTYVQHRIDGKQETFFIVNSDKENSRDYLLTLKKTGRKKLFRWDAVDGSVCRADAQNAGEDLKYTVTLPPAGSIILTLSSPVAGILVKDKTVPEFRNAEVLTLPSAFNFVRKDKNVLVLDRISVSYDGKNFEKEEPEWRVRKKIANHFGTQDALGWQPWVAARKKIFEGKGGEIVLRYKFSSKVDKPKSYLIIEDMQKGRVVVNGRQITWDDGKQLGWHWDRGFRMVETTELVKPGENLVDFSVHYDFLTEVESAYIVGDFGVEMESPYKGRIVRERGKIDTGSWVGQGYPFYSGRLVYKTGFKSPGGERFFLRILKPSGILFNVRINGREAGKIMWSPHILEITRFVRKKGGNLIELELISSLQNSWGPLHERKGEDTLFVGPDAFENESEIREEFSLFNYGIGGMEILAV